MKISMVPILRISALPLVIFFYLSGGFIQSDFLAQYGKLVALALLAAAASTDVMGAQASDADRLFSKVANKALVLAGLLLVITDFDLLVGGFRPTGCFLPMPLWFAVVAVFAILGSDLVISGVHSLASGKNVETAPDNLAKAKLVVQYIAVGLLMFYAFADAHELFGLEAIGTIVQVYEFAALFALAAATVMCVVSAGNCLYQHRELFFDKREKKGWGEK